MRGESGGIKNLLDNVGVPESFEETDLTDGRRWHTVVFFLQSDFLQGHDRPSLQVTALVHDTVGTFSKLLLTFVTVQLRGFLHESRRLWLLLDGHLRIHIFSGGCVDHLVAQLSNSNY